MKHIAAHVARLDFGAVVTTAAALTGMGLLTVAPWAHADNYGPDADAKFFAALHVNSSKLPGNSRDLLMDMGHKVCALQRTGMDDNAIQQGMVDSLGNGADRTTAESIILAADVAYCPEGAS